MSEDKAEIQQQIDADIAAGDDKNTLLEGVDKALEDASGEDPQPAKPEPSE